MADTHEQTNDIDFTEAFDMLAGLGDKPIPANLLTATDTAEPAAPAVTPEDDTDDAGTDAAEPAAPAAPPVATPPAPALTPEEMLAQIRDAVTQRPEPQPAAPAPEPEPAAPAVYSPEDQQLISRYMDEWPEVAQAEATIRRGEYQQLVQHIFGQIKSYLQPFEQTLSAVAAETQIQQLQQVVPDYDQIDVNAVKTWAAQQPAYLQPAYQHVIERGTPDEVADLIQRFRQSTAPAAPTAPATPAAPVVPKKVEPALPADAKQAASSLAPVSSKRSSVAPSSEPTDFDSAFEAAAKTL